MIFYDEYDKFLGADKASLEFFNCRDIYDFDEKIGDVANLFVKKEGYIYKFENYNWIDFVNYSEEPIKKVLISIDDAIYEAEIKISEIFPIININDSSVIYGIEFKNPTKVKNDDVELGDVSKIETIDEITINSTKELPPVNTKISIDISKNAEAIEVDEELYRDLLSDFVIENAKYIKIAEDSIKKSDYSNIGYVVSVLKSISINLKLDDLIPVLNAIDRDVRNKNYKNIEKFLEIYKKEVDSIEHFIDKNS